MTHIMLLALLAVLAFVTSARADLVTWELSGVTFTDGGGITGSFVYDTAHDIIPLWNITVTAPATVLANPNGGAFITEPTNPFVLTPSNSGSAVDTSLSWTTTAVFTTPVPTTPGEAFLLYQLVLGGLPGLPSASWPEYVAAAPAYAISSAVSDPIVPWGYYLAGGSIYVQGFTGYYAVPAPPSAILLASGLMGLAVARLRKRWGN
jgi:hypothetical protein